MSRILHKLFVFTCFSLFSVSPSFAVDVTVLPAKGEGCTSLRAERELTHWQCAGPDGHSFSYSDHVMRAGIAFGRYGKETKPVSDDLSWRPSGEGLGSRIEWRQHGARTVTAIVSRWRSIEDSVRDRNLQELLVVKVLPQGSCAIGIVAAFSENAMRLARNIADEIGPGFRCGIDKPRDLSGLANSETTKLDERFDGSEMLDHNGSIVELRRSRIGMIEIRYREPRAALKLEPGRLLFEGQEHNGRIEGRAFVFKSGCSPVGYDVSGARTDGLLILEGRAPRRGRDCAIIGTSKDSQHARLTFAYEPVLDAAAGGVFPDDAQARGNALRASRKSD